MYEYDPLLDHNSLVPADNRDSGPDPEFPADQPRGPVPHRAGATAGQDRRVEQERAQGKQPRGNIALRRTADYRLAEAGDDALEGVSQ